MEKKPIKSSIWHRFGKKHRLSLRDQHDDGEVWYMFISPLRAVAVAVGVVLILFILILSLAAYTPVLDLIPGYPGSRTREQLVQGVLRLDSLSRRLEIMQEWSDNIALVMAGKTPVVRGVAPDDSTRIVRENVPRSRADSILRTQIETDPRYRLADSTVRQRSQLLDRELIAPLTGPVVQRFDPRAGRFGTGIRIASPSQVSAVQDGTVILNLWTPQDGYVAQIQHPGDFVSVYKHATRLLKSVGQRVRRGEVIGYVSPEEEGSDLFVLELWHDGTAVDPQKYIAF